MPGEMTLFILKVFLGFIIGGAWIAGVSRLSEVSGTRLGGLFGGLPSTMVVSLFFIAWSDGRLSAYDATLVIPLAFASNTISMTAYVLLVKRSIPLGLIGSLLIWALCLILLTGAVQGSFNLGLAINALVLFLCYVALTRGLNVRPKPGIRITWGIQDLLPRAAIGGSVIALAIVLSRFSGPTLAGIFSVFPAVAFSTIWFIYRAGGVEFSRSVVPALILSMVVNCSVYTVVFRAMVQEYPIGWTTLVAFGSSIFSGLVLLRFHSKYAP